MKRILKAGFLCQIFLVAQGLSAQVLPVADHLKCYQIQDKLDLRAIVNLDSKQFGLEKGCKVENAVALCVPTSKHVVKSNVQTLPIHGKPQPGDTICYKVSCPEVKPQNLHVADQFGKRKIRKHQPRLLCTPAVKLPIQDKCGFNSDGVCNGPCPERQECRIIESGGQKDCRCVDVIQLPCGFDAAGQCGGDCPDPTIQKCELVPGTTGTVDCKCVTPCHSTGIRQCGGDCPPNLICRMGDADEPCACREPGSTCALDANGVCGGSCPVGQQCVSGAAGCACQ